MEKLSYQEENVMQYVWQLKECVVKDIQKLMPDPKPPYTTIASVVKNLEQKGFLNAKKYGNVYVYSPKVEEDEYKKTFMSGVVKSYFENSYKELVSFFAKEKKVSKKDLEEIISMIEKGTESRIFGG
ncbi:BlaI family penicillinase repressor [Dysgonomonas sp. PH5-45]|uniref:BlaI/MecI/CopY family transcriptional regulator n=1 Tax=unclassified Dysgonomonas TaxID=2630389 RepID=UPI00247404D6|nr:MULTISPECIES: BlaI/MecI/CopY family transcriptional regulator [unclassified Dysgonomonas]MDH6355311.1 BlaI family penicillinase repressor [Dysgonomonas sp. PH5-45]MDH6388209.1 BlaI family penicillinase repressor [Dysgonomonas sp. PH5-37]